MVSLLRAGPGSHHCLPRNLDPGSWAARALAVRLPRLSGRGRRPAPEGCEEFAELGRARLDEEARARLLAIVFDGLAPARTRPVTRRTGRQAKIETGLEQQQPHCACRVLLAPFRYGGAGPLQVGGLVLTEPHRVSPCAQPGRRAFRLRSWGVTVPYGPDVYQLHEPGEGGNLVHAFPWRLALDALTQPKLGNGTRFQLHRGS